MEIVKVKCEVLIVDDNNDLCSILQQVITDKCSIHIEHTLSTADAYLGKHEPNIILLDNNLPDGLGIQSIRNIRDAHPGVKIVLMTAEASEGLLERAIKEGAASFICKPFTAAVLNEMIFTLCPYLRAA
jgi:two-component system chemotaxis response regulator CheY